MCRGLFAGCVDLPGFEERRTMTVVTHYDKSLNLIIQQIHTIIVSGNTVGSLTDTTAHQAD